MWLDSASFGQWYTQSDKYSSINARKHFSKAGTFNPESLDKFVSLPNDLPVASTPLIAVVLDVTDKPEMSQFGAPDATTYKSRKSLASVPQTSSESVETCELFSRQTLSMAS